MSRCHEAMNPQEDSESTHQGVGSRQRKMPGVKARCDAEE